MDPDRLHKEWLRLGGASTGISFLDFQRQFQMGLDEMGKPGSGLGKEQEASLNRALDALDGNQPPFGKEKRG